MRCLLVRGKVLRRFLTDSQRNAYDRCAMLRPLSFAPEMVDSHFGSIVIQQDVSYAVDDLPLPGSTLIQPESHRIKTALPTIWRFMSFV